MKNKLIAVVIAICVIGGIVAVVALSSNSNNQSNLNNKVVQDKVTEKKSENNVENNNKKSRTLENGSAEKKEVIDGNNENVNPSENYQGNTPIHGEENNNIIENGPKESTPRVDQKQNEDLNMNTPQLNKPNVNTPNSETPNADIPKPSSDSNFMSEVESMIFAKVNEERSKNGVPPLEYNSTMEHYARIKSQDMGDRGYFDHKNPEGELITAQMQKDGVTYNAWGENIAYIGGTSDAAALANQFMDIWMNSAGHRANILSSNFTSIGVGVYKIGNTVYATQEFCR